MRVNVEFKNKYVKIPTSMLGKDGEIGEIIEKFTDYIKVNFSGHIGIYTILKHQIIVMEDN